MEMALTIAMEEMVVSKQSCLVLSIFTIATSTCNQRMYVVGYGGGPGGPGGYNNGGNRGYNQGGYNQGGGGGGGGYGGNGYDSNGYGKCLASLSTKFSIVPRLWFLSLT